MVPSDSEGWRRLEARRSVQRCTVRLGGLARPLRSAAGPGRAGPGRARPGRAGMATRGEGHGPGRRLRSGCDLPGGAGADALAAVVARRPCPGAGTPARAGVLPKAAPRLRLSPPPPLPLPLSLSLPPSLPLSLSLSLSLSLPLSLPPSLSLSLPPSLSLSRSARSSAVERECDDELLAGCTAQVHLLHLLH